MACDLEASCVWLITSLETFNDEIFGEKNFMFFF